MFRSLIAGIVLLAAAQASPEAAVQPGGADDFQRIITEQFAAFNADDEIRAFSYMSPALQRQFVNPHDFMAMVKQGYQPVYRQKSYLFAGNPAEGAQPLIQKVILVDRNSGVWTAIYAFEKQRDGSWRINGCLLFATESADA